MRKPLYTIKKSFLAAFSLKMFIAFIISAAIGAGIYFGSEMFYIPIGDFAPDFLLRLLGYNWFLVDIAVSALLPAIVLLVQLALIIRVKSYKIKIYENRIVISEGILFATSEQHLTFDGSARFIINRSFLGRFAGVAQVTIIWPAGFTLTERFIRRPNKLKNFISTVYVGRNGASGHLSNSRLGLINK